MPVTVCPWDDPTAWNDFTSSVPMPHFQQSWEWGELAPQLSGEAVRLAATRDGRIVGAAQVFVNPLGGTGRTHLYLPRGPVSCSPQLDVLGPLLDASRKLAQDVAAVGLRVEPNVPANSYQWKNALSAMGLRPTYPPSQPRSSWTLDLRPGLEELLAQMKQKTRYNIRLAEKRGVEVSEGDPTELLEFYSLLRETAQRDKFFIHEMDVYERMFELFCRTDRFTMLLARFKGKLIAAVTLIAFGNTCWYMHGASSNEHRNLMAPYLLQWKAIGWARGRGCEHYDFRAVPDILREDQDMYGVYRFKEGFGGRQSTLLPTYGLPYRPLLYGLWQFYFAGRFRLDAYQRRRKGLPARQFA